MLTARELICALIIQDNLCWLLLLAICFCRFPFYYEFKIVFVLWLLSPATKGSSVLYRKFVHPQLTKREAVSCVCRLYVVYMVTLACLYLINYCCSFP